MFENIMDNLKGWRTIAAGAAIAIAPAALNYLAGVNWQSVVGPNTALVIAGAVTIGMRLITSTPVGKS